MRAGESLPADGGTIRMTGTDTLRALDLEGPFRSVGVEQSNVSFIANDQAIVKIYRRLRAGEQPEIAVSRFLSEDAGFRNTPAFLGAAEYVPAGGQPLALAVAFAFIRNQGDAWNVLLDGLALDFDGLALLGATERPGAFAHPLDLGAILGRRTAELHAAFAAPTRNAAFRAGPIGTRDVARWVKQATRDVTRALDIVKEAMPGLSGEPKSGAAALASERKAILARVAAAAELPVSGSKTRIHGDFHLGQVLVAETDVYMIDFEGEPQRGLAERQEKTSPLRDVAGMLRSLDYAAWSAIDRRRERTGTEDPAVRTRAFAWRDGAVRQFLEAYGAMADEAGFLPERRLRKALLELFLIQKAAYEVQYEAANRPAWLSIPIRGLLGIVSGKGGWYG